MENKKEMVLRSWVQLALFLAIAVLLQGIRMLMPMIPGPINMFLIGSLVNMMLVFAIWWLKNPWTIIMGVFLPVVAFLQGQLAFLPMIPVVAAGNAVIMLLAWKLEKERLLYIAPLLKAAVLFGGTQLVLHLFQLPAPMVKALSFMMSWPQIVTGLIGIVLAKLIYGKTKDIMF